MTEYQKIPGPFKRDPKTNLLIEGEWSDPALAALEYSDDWFFTEKIDGTNIRVIWDGYRVEFAGRTDRAVFPSHEAQALAEVFGGPDKETLFEQQFGSDPAVLYGELYGPKIQHGGDYRSDIAFILFDVKRGNFWLSRENVEDVADGLGLDVVPIVLGGADQDSSDLWDAINLVRAGLGSTIALQHSGNDIFAEGLVGTTRAGLLNRRGERVVVKIKHRDFYGKINK